jgi:hypothetical protein
MTSAAPGAPICQRCVVFKISYRPIAFEACEPCRTAAIMRLGCLAENAEREETHVAACNALLDRGLGKPLQPVVSDVSGSKTLSARPIHWTGMCQKRSLPTGLSQGSTD